MSVFRDIKKRPDEVVIKAEPVDMVALSATCFLEDSVNWDQGSAVSSEMEFDYDSCSDSKPKRKRQRLDHLSQDEKMMRRKMKNRVAAQSARDRKKARMDELEETLQSLTRERMTLLRANEALAERNRQLLSENNELKVRVAIKHEAQDMDSSSTAAKSAALTSDRQQNGQTVLGHAQTLTTMMALMVLSLVATPSNSYSTCLSSVPLNSSEPSVDQAQKGPKAAFHRQWWGSQQKGWNPAYIEYSVIV
ncbi:X-box-binding protein 1 [Halotydeus destructor]|nr:X-box-binding protein 1 [Halotydeus destructor]